MITRGIFYGLGCLLAWALPAEAQRRGLPTIDVLRQASQSGHIETEHLDIITYLSDEVVAPGAVFSIVFDIEPRTGIHVYAPGARNYRTIAFTLDANPMLVARPLSYPKSEIYHFKALDERVPVFQHAFRLTQRVALRAAREGRPAPASPQSITGTLTYQACDDLVCFMPRSVRVSYSVKVKQLDTQRVTAPK